MFGPGPAPEACRQCGVSVWCYLRTYHLINYHHVKFNREVTAIASFRLEPSADRTQIRSEPVLYWLDSKLDIDPC